MPKIIENLNRQLIKTGKELLIKEGYKALTIREVAKRSGIAIGTVYNYFSSKDELVAQIMMQDWISVFSNGKSKDQSDNCLDGLKNIYECILVFTEMYRPIWQEYGSMSAVTSSRHALLIQQIADRIAPLFEQYEILDDNSLSSFLSEIILAAAIREDVTFETLRPFIRKLIS